ncbi:hypothetical protein F9K97_03170 [Brucella anthropi]|uniref:hypothetical protein n=1 Tax=Brucella anthropi TaxID=529 RepID=UPI00124C3602|nr:hypothetical protein [Brucella anthropi]KAB2788120.1 hypothetical protein F9K97_03170 [Brucella anthropi]
MADELHPITCKDYATDMQKLVAENSNNKKIGGNGFNVNIVALGSYLSETGRKFAELTTKESESIYLSLYLTCQENPEMPAIDAAVLSGKHIRSQSTETSTAPTVDAPPSITASEIAAGISKKKTELEQEKWWESNMSGKTYQLTGKVTEVEKGTFSGYWVDVDIGRSILVRCGMSSKWTDQVSKIKKGQTFTCVGEVANTWTSFFKTMFQVDAG